VVRIERRDFAVSSPRLSPSSSSRDDRGGVRGVVDGSCFREGRCDDDDDAAGGVCRGGGGAGIVAPGSGVSHES
jgi:hypothetical protein